MLFLLWRLGEAASQIHRGFRLRMWTVYLGKSIELISHSKMLLRLIDDYLLVTTSPRKATKFLQMMLAGRHNFLI